MATFCSVVTPHLVYAGPRTREEFDSIPLRETVHPWRPDKSETLLRWDGQQYESRCHSKQLGDHSGDTPTVIFQWFEYRVATPPEAPPESPHAEDPVLPQLERCSEPSIARGLEAETKTPASLGGSGKARRVVAGGAR